MSDYCCGVKQANKQCVWMCNGSIQTFLCVCEAPARFSVWLTQQREPVFHKQLDARSSPRMPEEPGALSTHLRLDVQLIDTMHMQTLIYISTLIANFFSLLLLFFTLFFHFLSLQGYPEGANKLRSVCMR